MTYKEIMKSADNETVKQRVKAIYPHIVVSGDIDKPYYSIHWYDIEKEEMYCGFSSFKLELVRKWLKEEFEVVEADIDDLINRQKAEIERSKSPAVMQIEVSEKIEKTIKAEAVKEFAERLKEYINGIIERHEMPMFPFSVAFVSGMETKIDNLVKEMVGEG